MQRFGVAGVGVKHFPGRAIRDEVKGGGQQRGSGVLKQSKEIAVQFRQELSGLHGQWFEFFNQRPDHRGHQGGTYAVAGDIAMLENEVNPVLKALRSNGLDVVAIHHHMINTQPMIIFLHYWGRGPAEKLATGFKAAVDQLGKK